MNLVQLYVKKNNNVTTSYRKLVLPLSVGEEY